VGRGAGGLGVEMSTADPAHELNRLVDSALVVEWDGRVVYNANDCPPYDDGVRYLRARHPRVDLALLPYAPGSSYPACFTNLSTAAKEAEGRRILEATLARYLDTVRALEPGRAMPFADAYVVGGSRAPLQRFVPHPPGPGIVRDRMAPAGPGARGRVLNPGKTVDLEDGSVHPDEPFHVHTEADRERYIREHLLEKVYDHERFVVAPAVSIARLLAAARARLWQEQERCGCFPAYSYYLDVPDRRERHRVPLDQPKTEAVPWDAPLVPPYLRVSAPATLATFLLIGHVSS